MQDGLVAAGIEPLVGGGVGLDLLVTKYLPGALPREHGDIDFYIPIRKRDLALEWMRQNGYIVDKWSLGNAVHAIIHRDQVKFDLFSIEGNPDSAFVPNASAVGILVQQQGRMINEKILQ